MSKTPKVLSTINVSELGVQELILKESGWKLKADSESTSHKASNLVDGQLGSYWQSNASCPHPVHITFTNPELVEFIAIYIDKPSDGNYTPEEFTVEGFNLSQSVIPKEKYKVPSSSKGWIILPLAQNSHQGTVVTKITWAVAKNFDGGCDTKVHACRVFGGVVAPDFDAMGRLQTDMARSYPYGEDGDALIMLGDNITPCHRFVMASHSSVFSKALHDEEFLESGIFHVNEQHGLDHAHLAVILFFLYTGRIGQLVSHWSRGDGRLGHMPSAAHFALEYDIPILRSLCSEYLLRQVGHDVTVDDWIFGLLYGDDVSLDFMLNLKLTPEMTESIHKLPSDVIEKLMTKIPVVDI